MRLTRRNRTFLFLCGRRDNINPKQYFDLNYDLTVSILLISVHPKVYRDDFDDAIYSNTHGQNNVFLPIVNSYSTY